MASCPTCGGAMLTERPHVHPSSVPIAAPVDPGEPPEEDPAMRDLTGERDAMKWADEFDRIFPGVMDKGTMLGWFANAIESGVIVGRREAAPVDPGEDVVERLPDGIIRNGDRALTPPHRDDDKLCGCDSCMEYWAEDEGVNWSRLIPQRRVALRVMDSGDDRLEPLRTAFVENIEGSAQGEIDARRVPGLLRVEGSIGSTLHVGTDYRVVEIREHHEPSGIEGEPPIVTTVIRFDPILAPVDRVGGEGLRDRMRMALAGLDKEAESARRLQRELDDERSDRWQRYAEGIELAIRALRAALVNDETGEPR